jgi:hypothetical protein
MTSTKKRQWLVAADFQDVRFGVIRAVSGRVVVIVLPLSAADYPAVIDQFDSDVDSFQFGYVFTLVLGAIVSDRGATIRIRNHYHRSRRLIAGNDLAGFIVVALDPREFPQVNLCQIIHGAFWRPPRKIADNRSGMEPVRISRSLLLCAIGADLSSTMTSVSRSPTCNLCRIAAYGRSRPQKAHASSRVQREI